MRGLVTSGVEPSIATAIVQRARARVAPDEGLAVAKAPDLLSELIHALPTAPPLWAPAMPGRHGSSPMALHALLGPTGRALHAADRLADFAAASDGEFVVIRTRADLAALQDARAAGAD